MARPTGINLNRYPRNINELNSQLALHVAGVKLEKGKGNIFLIGLTKKRKEEIKKLYKSAVYISAVSGMSYARWIQEVKDMLNNADAPIGWLENK